MRKSNPTGRDRSPHRSHFTFFRRTCSGIATWRRLRLIFLFSSPLTPLATSRLDVNAPVALATRNHRAAHASWPERSEGKIQPYRFPLLTLFSATDHCSLLTDHCSLLSHLPVPASECLHPEKSPHRSPAKQPFLTQDPNTEKSAGIPIMVSVDSRHETL